LPSLPTFSSRPKFEKKIAASQLSIDEIVDLYAGLAALVRPTSVPRIATDPDDDIVIGTGSPRKLTFSSPGIGLCC
jgi:uncharacterized protein